MGPVGAVHASITQLCKDDLLLFSQGQVAEIPGDLIPCLLHRFQSRSVGVRQWVVRVHAYGVNGIPPGNSQFLAAMVGGVDDRAAIAAAHASHHRAPLGLAMGGALQLRADSELLDPDSLSQFGIMVDEIPIGIEPRLPLGFFSK